MLEIAKDQYPIIGSNNKHNDVDVVTKLLQKSSDSS